MKWYTKNVYVESETGLILDEKEAKTNYIIINKKKETHVNRSTGYVTFTNECKRRTHRQTNLFETG